MGASNDKPSDGRFASAPFVRPLLYLQVVVLIAAVTFLSCDGPPTFLDKTVCPLVAYGGLLGPVSDLFSYAIPLVSLIVPPSFILLAAVTRIGWIQGTVLATLSMAMAAVSIASIIPLWT